MSLLLASCSRRDQPSQSFRQAAATRRRAAFQALAEAPVPHIATVMPPNWTLPTAPADGPAALEVLAPPKHFAIVEPALYRATMPATANFPFLKQLGLKRVIILSAESVARSVSTFFEENGIAVSHTGASERSHRNAWKKTWKPLEDEVVKASLELVLRADMHPMLICDTSGVQRVGVVVGCLRRLQWWNLNSIVNEYRSFAGAKTRHVHEQMIELFDLDLVVIPRESPPWYEAQQQMQDDDDEKFQEYVNAGRLLSCGKMRDHLIPAQERTQKDAGAEYSDVARGQGSESRDSCAYRVYYYSTDSPLNSVDGALPPRIQRLQ